MVFGECSEGGNIGKSRNISNVTNIPNVEFRKNEKSWNISNKPILRVEY